MKGKFVIDTLGKTDHEKEITCVITISRLCLLDDFFKNFEKIKMPYERIHLLVYDNTDDVILGIGLKGKLTAGPKDVIFPFRSVRLYKSYRKGRYNVLNFKKRNWYHSKLYNIWHMWLDIRKMIHTDTFFQLEDDTLSPPYAFKALYHALMKNKNIGFVTGIETGRWPNPQYPVRLGVHWIKRDKKRILMRLSCSPYEVGTQEIDAAGVYCFAARTEAWLSGFPAMKGHVCDLPFWGMDNTLTNNIKNNGWKILANFDVWCEHMQPFAGRIITFGKKQAVQQVDVWIPEIEEYTQCVTISRSKGKALHKRTCKK